MKARSLPILSLLLVLAAGATPTLAAGKVQVELVGDAAGSAMAFQGWLQALGKAGIPNVRIRSAEPTDKVGVQVHGSQDTVLYVVTGVVLSNEELQLPCGRIKRSDLGRLKRWLDELAEQGPTDRRPAKTAFGLTAEQFDKLRENLGQAVDFPTLAVARNQVVEKISQRAGLTLSMDAETREAVGDDKLEEELEGVACGTALACALRPSGLSLVPRMASRQIGLSVVKARPDLEIWPIGWPPDKPIQELVPELYEFRNVSLDKVPAVRALQAIGQRLKLPILYDHNALARHGVDPAKAMVTLSRSRTNYSLALRKFLFQAGLKFEVRVDEAGKPLLWISTVKPV